MRAILKLLHSFLLSLCLLWSLPGFSDVKQSIELKHRSLETFVTAYEMAFHKAIAKVNKDRKNLSRLVSELPEEQRKYFLHYFRMNRISSLPVWKKKGVGYEMSHEGNSVFFSPRLSYQSKILINGRAFQFKSHDPKVEFERLFKFHQQKRKFSFMNLIIDEAHAVCGTGLCILLVLGGAALVAYMASDFTDTVMSGEVGTLDGVLDEMKIKSGQCTRDTRKLFFKKDESVPGEQETFNDFKKLQEVMDTSREPSKRELKTYVMQRIIGVKVDSCEEFAGLWDKHSGALAKQESQRSISANQARQQGKISKRKEVCSVVERYADCMSNYIAQEKKFNGERRYEGDYNNETGLFRDRTIGEWISDKTGIGK